MTVKTKKPKRASPTALSKAMAWGERFEAAAIRPGPLTLLLPMPPSVNNYRAIFNNRLITSKAGRKYHIDVQAAVRSTHGKLTPMRGRLAVTVLFFAPDRRRSDLDNRLKPLLDSMKGAGVFDDDSQIDTLTITRHGMPFRSGGAVEVTIERLPDESPLLDNIT